MTVLKDYAAVNDLIAVSRDSGRRLTNFFPEELKVAHWCATDSFSEKIVGSTQFLIRRDKRFANLYFLASDVARLEADLKSFLAESKVPRLVVDLVGPDIMRVPLQGAFTRAGFKKLAELQRMGRKTPAEALQSSGDIRIAAKSDIPSIQSIFCNHFKAEIEQLPIDAELERWIDRNEILVSRDEANSVSGFVIFDLSVASLYLRYWFVDPICRGKGVGSSLMNAMFHKAQSTKRQYFWVLTDNENAIKRYLHYGFNFEPMKDVVMALDRPNMV